MSRKRIHFYSVYESMYTVLKMTRERNTVCFRVSEAPALSSAAETAKILLLQLQGISNDLTILGHPTHYGFSNYNASTVLEIIESFDSFFLRIEKWSLFSTRQGRTKRLIFSSWKLVQWVYVKKSYRCSNVNAMTCATTMVLKISRALLACIRRGFGKWISKIPIILTKPRKLRKPNQKNHGVEIYAVTQISFHNDHAKLVFRTFKNQHS